MLYHIHYATRKDYLENKIKKERKKHCEFIPLLHLFLHVNKIIMLYPLSFHSFRNNITYHM